MLHCNALVYIDKMLRFVCQNNKPFGGKTILMSGDWKQLPPVLPGKTFIEQLHASIKLSALFTKHFKTMKYNYILVKFYITFSD
jgi:hypothetical protein